MQNRRGVDWMRQLGATKEGRDVTHVARRMTIEHRDEHLDVKVKQSQKGLDRSWRFQEAEAHRFQDNQHKKVVRLSALRTGPVYPLRNTPGTDFC
jgi:hypothetical protein